MRFQNVDLDKFSEMFISFMKEKSGNQRGIISYAVQRCMGDIRALKAQGFTVSDIVTVINNKLDDDSKIHYQAIFMAINRREKSKKGFVANLTVSNTSDKESHKITYSVTDNEKPNENIPNEWIVFNQAFDSPIPEKVIIEAISKGITPESIEEKIASIDDKMLRRRSALAFINNQLIDRKFLK